MELITQVRLKPIVCNTFYSIIVKTYVTVGSKFGNKNSFAKKSECSKENNVLGFVKHFSEFTKGMYETCNCDFFNLALIIIVAAF